MKTKIFGKKLTLNKKTIADLSIGKMKNAQGGLPAAITYTCPSYCCGTSGMCTHGETGDPFCHNCLIC